MNAHLAHALPHPVFDPERQITGGHYWRAGRLTICLTVNIGME